jgi:hypothetical protein
MSCPASLLSGRGALSPDLSFNAADRGEVYAQPFLA